MEGRQLPVIEEVDITILGTDVAINKRKCFRCGDTIMPGMECLVYRYVNRYGGGDHSICPICGLEMLREAQTTIKQGLSTLKILQPALRKYAESNKVLAGRLLQRL